MTWPARLRLVALPEDDFWGYSDYRKDRVWQALMRIVEKRGITVHVADLHKEARDHVRGVYIHYDNVDIILIDKYVPNWYKPSVFAHELGHYKLHRGKLNMAAYNSKGAYYSAIEREAEEFGKRLRRFIKTRLNKQSQKNGRK